MLARWSVLAVPAAALLVVAAYGALSVETGAATREFTLEVVAVACDAYDDGVCLRYGGTAPGPLLDVRVGDSVVVNLWNRIPETVAALDVDADVKAHLANASVSFHAHGVSVAPEFDGVPAHAGTNLVPAVAAPDGAYRYEFRAAFAGAWHYHDHALGHDGAEGTLRGLFGGLIVRGGAARVPDHVFDVRVHDNGVNSGAGMDAEVAVGESFELLVAGLGNRVWTFTLTDPSGGVVGTVELGPGISESIKVDAAEVGAYEWSATWGPTTHTGQVIAS